MNVREIPDGVQFQIRVLPRASRTELAGVEEGVWKMRITSPPIEGRANGEVISFLARLFNVAPSRIKIVQGEKSRIKTILVKGITSQELIEGLGKRDGREGKR